MAVRRETPMYKVWEELNQIEDDAKEVGAHDVESAARWCADRFDRDEDSDLTWPRYFVVIDPQGKRWRVSVDRQIEYSYRAAKKEKA